MFGSKINLRQVVSIFVVVATCAMLFLYIQSHPTALSGLKNVTPIDLITVNLLYIASILTLAVNLNEIIRRAGKRITTYESLLVTSYASWANYLIPGQSGPGLRAVYLKVKHGVPVRLVMIGTLVYLLWLVAISTFMVLYAAFGIRGWVVLLVMTILLIVASILIFMLRADSFIQNKEGFAANIRLVVATGVWTLVQLILIGTIYYVELIAIDTRIGIVQAIGYAGVSNLSLLVAITPAAIGVREIFLAMSQGIHSISIETIAAASAVDRASYVVFLVELSLFIALSHAKDRFRLSE